MGLKGEIVSTPGHSDDSVTLGAGRGVAFTGDLTPLMFVPDDPADLAYQSWQSSARKACTRSIRAMARYIISNPARWSNGIDVTLSG